MTHIDSEQWLAWWRYARNVIILLVVSGFLLHDGIAQGPATGRALATYAGVLAGAVGWLLVVLRRVAGLPAIAVCAGAGIWLSAVLPGGSGPAFTVAAVSVAATALPIARTAVLTGLCGVVLGVVLVVRGASWTAVVSWVGVLCLIMLVGWVRRQREERAEQRLLLAEERALAETLAERAYLAREIHDVLAHSLSALAVQLETAAAMLERDRTAEAAALVDKAGRLARDGLTEARRAVGTLRGDPIPLAALITELADGATLTVGGAPRDLPPEAGLVLYRAAQEALANIRKHAPGSEVTIRIAYKPSTVALAVRNGPATRPPLTGLSSGYGLIGMKERAELAGGTVNAGPDGDGWLVDVRIPA